MVLLYTSPSGGSELGSSLLDRREPTLPARTTIPYTATGRARRGSLVTQAPQVVHWPVVAQLPPNWLTRMVASASVVPRMTPRILDCAWRKSWTNFSFMASVPGNLPGGAVPGPWCCTFGNS